MITLILLGQIPRRNALDLRQLSPCLQTQKYALGLRFDINGKT